jgi:hypothetical protein
LVVVSFGLELSLNVINTVKVPEAEGVPLNTPVALFKLSPLGAPVAPQEYGALPPAGVNVWL